MALLSREVILRSLLINRSKSDSAYKIFAENVSRLKSNSFAVMPVFSPHITNINYRQFAF